SVTELYQTFPIVERERPATLAWVNLRDTAQNRVLQFDRGELLCRADQLFGAHAVTQIFFSGLGNRSHIPQPRGVVGRRRHHALAVRAEGRAPPSVRMDFEDRRLLAAGGVPQPRSVVVRRRHHALAVGAEGRGPHYARMAFEDGRLLAAGGVPQPRSVVV